VPSSTVVSAPSAAPLQASQASGSRVGRAGFRAIAVATGLLVAAGALVGLGSGTAYASDASSLVSMTNSERSERGLPRLTSKSDLASVALKQAKRMAAAGKLFHNPNLSSDVSGWRYVGENVGYGSSAAKIHAALMNSAPHRANILDRDYTQIGVGAVRDDNGRLWIAQVFRKPVGGSTSSTAPKKKATVSKTTVKKAPAKKATSSSSKPTPKATPKATPKPTPTAEAPAPSPSPTIEQRLATIEQSRAGQAQGDPVADAIDFAQAMATLTA
jgi:uncharacterized protein YkwD